MNNLVPISDYLKVLRETMKSDIEEATRQFEVMMLRFEVIDLEQRKLQIEMKLKTAKEKLLARESAQPSNSNSPATDH